MSEVLRDLVVSLSLKTDNFSRNINSINRQIREAESSFRLAGAGIDNFGKTTDGMASRLTMLQANLLRSLYPDCRRVAEPVTKRLYVLSHVNCPAVLVECGFMSNNFEVLKLKESGYQSALALVIAASYLEYISESSLG